MVLSVAGGDMVVVVVVVVGSLAQSIEVVHH
jgi:hypothetical protein